jgi:hypothetical protein
MKQAKMSFSKKNLEKKLWCIYTMEFYSAIRNNDTMWFEGEWMQLEDIMLSELRKTKAACFLSYMEHGSKR